MVRTDRFFVSPVGKPTARGDNGARKGGRQKSRRKRPAPSSVVGTRTLARRAKDLGSKILGYPSRMRRRWELDETLPTNGKARAHDRIPSRRRSWPSTLAARTPLAWASPSPAPPLRPRSRPARNPRSRNFMRKHKMSCACPCTVDSLTVQDAASRES